MDGGERDDPDSQHSVLAGHLNRWTISFPRMGTPFPLTLSVGNPNLITPDYSVSNMYTHAERQRVRESETEVHACVFRPIVPFLPPSTFFNLHSRSRHRTSWLIRISCKRTGKRAIRVNESPSVADYLNTANILGPFDIMRARAFADRCTYIQCMRVDVHMH